jgi:lambda family phage portal protein
VSWLSRLFGRKTEAKPPRQVRYVFAGAQGGRLVADWLHAWMTGPNELRYELRNLRARSRELARNTAIAHRYLGLCEENILGRNGIALQMRLLTPRGDPDEDMNSAIEAAWDDWGKRGNCTLDGRYCWRDFEAAGLEQTVRDGEGLVELVEGAPNEYGFAVQLLDPDQLPEDVNAAGPSGGPIVIMGVEIDTANRPLAYHVLTRHPAESGGIRQIRRVPADRLLHFGRQTRAGQVRFAPWMTPVLLDLKMLAEYEMAELVASRASAAKMGFILPGPDAEGPDPDRPPEQQEQGFEVEPGVIKRLGPGETLADFNPTHPGEQFDPFVKAKLRSIAAGLDVSYASLTGDYERATWSSGRLALAPERDRWRVLQRWYADSLHQRVFARWLPWAVLRRKVQIPVTVPEAIAAATWEFRGWPYVDPEKEISALKQEVECGQTDLITAAAERGRDFESVMRNQNRALALAKKWGIPITLTTPAPAPAAPNAPQEAIP